MLSIFSKNPNGMKDGHLNQCKSCVKKRIDEWRKKNPEIVKERMRIQYERHKDKVIKRATEWNRKHKKRRKQIKDWWRKNNKDLANHLTKN